jgi:hypothetical protein
MDAVNKAIVADVFEDFEDIRKQYKLGDDKFKQGFKFAELISEGKSKTKAYEVVFNDKDVGKAARFARLKWVSSIIDRLIAGNHVLFADKHYQALTELYNIGINGDSERKTVREFVDNYFLASDARAFRQHVREVQPDVDLNVTVEVNGGVEVIDIPITVNFFWPDASV